MKKFKWICEGTYYREIGNKKFHRLDYTDIALGSKRLLHQFVLFEIDLNIISYDELCKMVSFAYALSGQDKKIFEILDDFRTERNILQFICIPNMSSIGKMLFCETGYNADKLYSTAIKKSLELAPDCGKSTTHGTRP